MKLKEKLCILPKGGIIGYVLIVLAVVIVLGYFGFDLRGIVESPQVQENISYFWNIIKTPVVWVWDFLVSLWNSFVDFMLSFGENFEEVSPESRLERFEAEVEGY